jgi:hypothetical protein
MTRPRAGAYRSNFWDIVAEVRDADPPTLSVTEGLVVLDEESVTNLMANEDGSTEGDGGMFHGFEITLTDGDAPGFSGGVYPFMFSRTGDIPKPAPVDDDVDLTGPWVGIVHTPMAPLSVTLAVDDHMSATVTTPLGVATLEHFRAGSGRVEGEFPLSMPGIGEFHNFLRLEARGGRLVGKTYARSQFGENAMPTGIAPV